MNFILILRSIQSWLYPVAYLLLLSGAGVLDTFAGILSVAAGALILLFDVGITIVFERNTDFFKTNRFRIHSWIWGGAGLFVLIGNHFFYRFTTEVDTGLIPNLRFLNSFIVFFLVVVSILFRFLQEMTGNRSGKENPGRNQVLVNNLVLLVFGFLLFSFVNYVSAINNPSIDFSPGYFSLSDNSKKIISGLKGDIRIYVFLPVQQAVGDARKSRTLPELYRIAEDVRLVFEQVSRANGSLKIEFRNAELTTNISGDFGSVTNGTIIVRRLDESPVPEQPYVERKFYVKKESDLGNLERDLVRSLIQVSSTEKLICFPYRNGERTPLDGRSPGGGGLQKIWEDTGFFHFRFKPLQEGDGWPGRIQNGCDVLLLSGPSLPYGDEARNSILQFLNGGGRALVLADGKSIENFSWLLSWSGSAYRIKKGDMSVVRTYPGLVFSDSLGKHPLTESLERSGSPFFIFPAKSYLSAGNKIDTSSGIKSEESWILKTVYRTFLDPNLNGIKDTGEESIQAPLAIALQGRSIKAGKGSDREFKLVFFSDVDWLNDRILNFPMKHKNTELAIESLLWLSESDLVAALPSEGRVSRRIRISEETKFKNLLFGVVLFPFGMVTVLVLLRFFVRRNHSVQTERRDT